MKNKFLVLFLLPNICFASLEKLGDILQIASPLAMLAISTIEDHQDEFITNYAESMAVAGLLKCIGSKTHFHGSARPDNTAYTGLPSGHTTSAYMPAVHYKYYGAHSSLPFYAAGIATGLSRIEANRHTAIQVLASLGISELIGYLNWRYDFKFIKFSVRFY